MRMMTRIIAPATVTEEGPIDEETIRVSDEPLVAKGSA